MEISTKYFGDIEIDQKEIINFKLPVYGFEDYKEFVLLSDSDIGESILLLQSVDEQDLCFLLVDSKMMPEEYKPEITESTMRTLKEKNIHNPEYWFITVIAHEFKNSTVNMKSPILLDLENRTGAQIILDGDYSLRAPLPFEEEGS